MRALLPSLVVLLSAAPASAATVRLASDYDPGYRGSGSWTDTLTVEASPGEANGLEVMVGPDDVRLTDSRAALVTRRGCAGAGTVTCARRQDAGLTIEVLTADGDDRVVIVGRGASFVTIDAGDGDDVAEVHSATSTVLGGGGGADRLAGATDALNRLDGGPGADTLAGGADGDVFAEGSDDRSPDRIDGGPGRDLVAYDGRLEGVRIDLAAGGGGAPGEGDVLIGVERATGGEGPDVLLGSDGPDELVTGDVADGDAVDGRAGDDVVSAGRGAAVRCGSGHDRVMGAPAALALDCERLEVGPLDLRLARVGGRVRLRIRPTITEAASCAVRVGPRDVALRRGRGRVVLPPSATALRLLAARWCPARGPRLRPVTPRPIALMAASASVSGAPARG